MIDTREAAAAFLKQLDPKDPLGPELFNAIARLVPTMCIEVVVVKTVQHHPKVWMTRRRSGDSYAGQLHCPGTVLRSGEDFHKALIRLGQAELGLDLDGRGSLKSGFFYQEERGWFYGQVIKVTLGELDMNPKMPGGWVDPRHLPMDTVSHHHEVIALAQID